jgi:hypothetical protein
MRYFLPLLIAGLGIAGTACEPLGFSRSETEFDYEFETERRRYSLPDSIEATLLNASSKTLYVREQGCTHAGIERHAGSDWEDVPIPIMCEQLATRPLSIESGNRLGLRLEAWMIEEADVVPGTYRLTLSVGLSEEGEYQKITSNQFRVVAEGPGASQSTVSKQ